MGKRDKIESTSRRFRVLRCLKSLRIRMGWWGKRVDGKMLKNMFFSRRPREKRRPLCQLMFLSSCQSEQKNKSIQIAHQI